MLPKCIHLPWSSPSLCQTVCNNLRPRTFSVSKSPPCHLTPAHRPWHRCPQKCSCIKNPPMGMPVYSAHTGLNQNSSCAVADSLVKNYYRNISQNINRNWKLLSRSANPNGVPRDSAACARRLWMAEWMNEWKRETHMNEWMNVKQRK